MTLFGDSPEDPKLLAKYSFFKKLLRQASEGMPELGGIADMLDDAANLAAIREVLKKNKAKPTERITFFVTGVSPEYLIDDPIWHSWWRDFRKDLGAKILKTNRKGRS